MKFYDAVAMKNLPPPEWIIQEMIQRNSHVLFYGPSGAGKSFIALEMAFALAAQDGTIFTPCARWIIVYVVAEGISGFGVRIKAWEEARGHKLNGEHDLWFYGDALQVANRKDVSHFIDEIKRQFPGQVLMVIIDTLARGAVGLEENSAKDMGLFVDGTEQIRKQLDCTVLVVHHSTKSQPDKERGSGTLYAAADTVISVKERNRDLIFECRKQKNSERFMPIKLHLYGREHSCTVERLDSEPLERTLQCTDKGLECCISLQNI